jgi:hypothetical protein
MSAEGSNANDVWTEFGKLATELLHPEGYIYGNAKPGDTIFYKINQGAFHYGIYIGEVKGVEMVIDNDKYTDSVSGENISSIRKKTYHQFAIDGKGDVKILKYNEAPHAEIQRRKRALENAQLLLKKYKGQHIYNLFAFNCQHFTTLCSGIRWEPGYSEKSDLRMHFFNQPVVRSKSSL